MGLRAFWSQQTTLGTTDRIEIHIDGFEGSPRELITDKKGFTFRHDEITDESSVFLSPNQNKIQQGKLDFYPKIRTAEDRQVLKDIADSDDYSVGIKWIMDGALEWKGYCNSKLLQGQESAIYSGRIRANDFEILKGIDFPLSSGRKVLITSLAAILGYTNFNLNIQTSTSWTVQGGDESEDFLNQVAHDQYALRSYGKTGNEQDEPITCWQAIERVAEPGLLIRQQHGKILVEQLTAFDEPQNVSQTLYDPSGTIINPTQPVDRRQAVYTSGRLGTLHVKRTSSIDGYPAIKRAVVKYNHRTKQNNIKFPDGAFVISNQQVSRKFSQLFISDGSQIISLSFNVNVDLPSNTGLPEMQWRITAGGYSWSADAGEWQPGVFFNDKPLSGGDFESAQGNYKYFANFNIYTEPTPPDADGQLEIEIQRVPGGVNGTTISVSNFEIINGLSAANTSYIQYQLTQQGGYPDKYTHKDTFLGEGPVDFSRGALSAGGTYLYDAFARRGETNYRKYHRVLLEETISTQRKRMPKIQAEIIGNYNPEKISIYRGKAYYYSGGKYRSVIGRWEPVWIEINVESESTDIFQDINKYADGGGASGGSVGLPGSDGSGVTDHGALTGLDDPGDHPWALQADLSNVADWGPADDRFLNEANNLSEITQVQGPKSFDSAIDLNGNPIQSSGNNALEFDAMGNVTVPGNLEVLGETLSANVENLDVDDPILKLADGNLTDALDIGFIGQRASENVGLIWDESADEFAAVRTDSDATTGNVNVTGYADFHAADTLLKSLILQEGLTIDDVLGYLRSQTFLGGFGGSGTELEPDGQNDWTLTVDNLVVRRLARFYELVVERVRANGGTVLVSPGAEKVTETAQVGAAFDWNGDYNPFAPGATNGQGQYYAWTDQYENTIEEDKLITIAEDDLLRRQEYNGRGTGVTEGGVVAVEGGSPTPAVNDPRRSFTMWITADSQPPAAGHEFAVIGNSSDPARQNGIIITASDSGNPYRRIYSGVDRLSKFGSMETVKGQDGRLDNMNIPHIFPDLDGTQINKFGAAWPDGDFYVNDGFFRGVIEVTGGNAETKDGATGKANQAYQDAKDYTDSKVSSQAGNAIIRSDSQPGTRPDGSSLTLGDLWVDTDNNDKPYTWDGSSWKPAYTVIQGNQISTQNLSAISTKTGVLTVDEKITIGDGSNDGIIESFNYDSSNGFRLQEANGKAILNNADIRGSFTADGDVTMGGAFSYDESSGVVKLGGNSSEGGVRLEINGYTSLPGGGYMNSDGIILSSDKHIGFGAPGTSGKNIDAGMYTDGNDLHISAFGSTTTSLGVNQAVVFDHKRVDDTQIQIFNTSGLKQLDVESSFVVITSAPSGIDIGAIRNKPSNDDTPMTGQTIDILNSTNSGITLRDASTVSGGNITGQGGANREIFPDTMAHLRYYGGRWHLLSEFG